MRMRWLVATCLVACCSLPALSQIRGEQPVDLYVHVFYSNDRKGADQIRVQLLTGYGTPLDDKFTDATGVATFYQVKSGTYRLRMSANNIEETTSDTFNLEAGERDHHESVHVELKPVADAQQSTPGGPPISAAELNIPDKARKEFDEGNAELSKQNFPEARKHYEKATELYPQYAWAFNNLGIIAMKQGNPVEAHNFFQRSIDADGSYANGYFNLGKLMAMEKKYAVADTLLAKAQSLDPMNPEVLLWLGNVELVEGKFDMAAQACRKGHTLPHDKLPALHIIAARAFAAEHDLTNAATEYTTYLKEAPNGPYAKASQQALADIARQSK